MMSKAKQTDWDTPKFTKREMLLFTLYAIGMVNEITAGIGMDIVSACRNLDSDEQFEAMGQVFTALSLIPEGQVHETGKQFRNMSDEFIKMSAKWRGVHR